MPNYIDILARNCPVYTGELIRPGSFGMGKWLCKDESSMSIDGNELILSPYDFDSVKSTLSYDIYRLTLASRQTHQDAVLGTGHLAWRLIKLYYSAFFSAAVISRLMGSCMVHLNDDEKIMVSKRCQANSLVFKVPSNLHVRLLDDCKIRVKRIDQPTHEGTWRLYCENLSEAIARASKEMALNRETQSVILKLEDTRKLHFSNSVPSYLSQIRNEINYRQMHGCWISTGGSANPREIFKNKVKDVAQVRLTNTLSTFSDLCKLTHSSLEEVIEYFKGKNSIGKRQLFNQL